MADTKVSALADIVTLAAGDKVPVADASDLTVSKSATMTEVATYVLSNPLVTPNITTADITLISGDSLYISQFLEIGSGFNFEMGAGSYLEIG